MDENFRNNPVDSPEDNKRNDDINNLTMDNKGNIHTDRTGTAAVAPTSRTYLVLGWISAAFTAFVSPYFAIAGITFGVVANRQERGKGNAVIITNIVLALFNLIFGLIFAVTLRRMILGY